MIVQIYHIVCIDSSGKESVDDILSFHSVVFSCEIQNVIEHEGIRCYLFCNISLNFVALLVSVSTFHVSDSLLILRTNIELSAL